METRRHLPGTALAAALFVLGTTGSGSATTADFSVRPTADRTGTPGLRTPVPAATSLYRLAQAADAESRELQPRYEPVPPQPKSSYNSSYIFGMTKDLAASTIAPAGKAPLFLLTVPLDIVLLPFTIIGGFFG
jgi:hypothetical protein